MSIHQFFFHNIANRHELTPKQFLYPGGDQEHQQYDPDYSVCIVSAIPTI